MTPARNIRGRQNFTTAPHAAHRMGMIKESGERKQKYPSHMQPQPGKENLPEGEETSGEGNGLKGTKLSMTTTE